MIKIIPKIQVLSREDCDSADSYLRDNIDKCIEFRAVYGGSFKSIIDKKLENVAKKFGASTFNGPDYQFYDRSLKDFYLFNPESSMITLFDYDGKEFAFTKSAFEEYVEKSKYQNRDVKRITSIPAAVAEKYEFESNGGNVKLLVRGLCIDFMIDELAEKAYKIEKELDASVVYVRNITVKSTFSTSFNLEFYKSEQR
ncbi:MAG: hypothetical protein ACP5N2_00880 [Candidatus Nanoarchaeia archaeon]